MTAGGYEVLGALFVAVSVVMLSARVVLAWFVADD